MKPIFMTFTKKDLLNFFVVMTIAVVVIPNIVPTSYWYVSILIPFLCLALAGIGQQIIIGYTGQLALGAAGFMAAGALPVLI
jgi:branched-chain amino acid transport system permease protein